MKKCRFCHGTGKQTMYKPAGKGDRMTWGEITCTVCGGTGEASLTQEATDGHKETG